MKGKKQNGAKIVNMPTVISGTTEQVAEQVNTAFILPVLHEFKANDPASATQFEAWFSENYHTHNWQFSMVDGIYQDKHTETCWKAWQAAQQQEGYVLVPVEPTEQMLLAGGHTYADTKDLSMYSGRARRIYGQMIKAAREAT